MTTTSYATLANTIVELRRPSDLAEMQQCMASAGDFSDFRAAFAGTLEDQSHRYNVIAFIAYCLGVKLSDVRLVGTQQYSCPRRHIKDSSIPQHLQLCLAVSH